MELFGLDIAELSRQAVRDRVAGFLGSDAFHRIATVNPEFLLLSKEAPLFRKSLKEADLRVADGIGIRLAFLLLGQTFRYRYPGADLMIDILELAEEKNLSVYLAIRRDGLSSYEEVREAVVEMFPKLTVGGDEFDTENNQKSVNGNRKEKLPDYTLPITDYHITLCNFGIPYQETFLASLKNNPGNIRIAMGVGGSFDYLTGKLPRAPRVMRTLGLEWLWRFFLQPTKRAKRLWRSVFVFPLKVLLEK